MARMWPMYGTRCTHSRASIVWMSGRCTARSKSSASSRDAVSAAADSYSAATCSHTTRPITTASKRTHTRTYTDRQSRSGCTGVARTREGARGDSVRPVCGVSHTLRKLAACARNSVLRPSTACASSLNCFRAICACASEERRKTQTSVDAGMITVELPRHTCLP